MKVVKIDIVAAAILSVWLATAASVARSEEPCCPSLPEVVGVGGFVELTDVKSRAPVPNAQLYAGGELPGTIDRPGLVTKECTIALQILRANPARILLRCPDMPDIVVVDLDGIVAREQKQDDKDLRWAAGELTLRRR